uniref:Doublecortin domain-containing protein n=1 Tax=Haemonchus placei TaxID=6290 RepID=A0A0N4W7N2_HAEPC
MKEFEWYRKPMSKNILLHSRSAHPLYIKANKPYHNEDKDTRESGEMDRKIARILEENGYTTDQPRTWRPFFAARGTPLVLPYVNERVAKKVNDVVKSSGLPVRLIFRPPANLKSLLTSSRIYEEKCGGGTVRTVSIKKFVSYAGQYIWSHAKDAVRSTSESIILPRKCVLASSCAVPPSRSTPFLKVAILHRTKDAPLERKLLEALAIKSLSPEMNNRDELMEALKLIS